MNKITLCILVLLLFARPFYGTHNRAGEITYRQLSANTFEFTIVTFTYTKSVVDRASVMVDWGDNTTSDVPRTLKETLPDFYYRNTYTALHTFPGPGIYEVVMQDPTRNQGVKNIPNSVTIYFSVKTTILISPEIGWNNTPVLLNYPIDKAALGRRFIHNPGAFDIDGDSLSYSLGTCTREKGLPIESYTLPKASDSIYINPVSGELIWDSPVDTGIFNIAINVEEWRNGIKIGNIVRDMQIEVYNSKNNPPVNENIKNFCIEAGKSLKTVLITTDTDNDRITQTISGGPFALNDTTIKYTTITDENGYTASALTWNTSCKHIRKQPYYISLKSTDQNAQLKLTDIDNFFIKVLPPAPKIEQIIPGNNTILIKWSKPKCPNPSGYEIYRSPGPSMLTIDSCNGGIPTGTTFIKIAYNASPNDTLFNDDNKGKGLDLGINYCYRIVAVYPDGALSYPSNEICGSLIAGIPVLTSANVTAIDPINGSVFVSWIKPDGLDTIPAPGPYEYRIYRTNNFLGNNFSLIYTFETNNLNDTTYNDTNLNTITFPYYYKVELYNNTPGNRFLIGNPETASTLYPDFIPSDNQLTVQFYKKVPWFNHQYIIFRQNPYTGQFDSIGYTLTGEFTDKNLQNNKTYTYRILSLGNREKNNINYKTLNWSHINSGTPIDNNPPCPPILNLSSNCDSSLNTLVWTNPNHYCADDVIQYKIYGKTDLNSDFTVLNTINNLNDTIFRHNPTGTMAACYAVSAVDSFGNESALSNIKCFNGCSGYKLPNFFTPNNDNTNDFFISYNPNNYVKYVEMKIYNRWGKLMFETNDPDIKWDGRDRDSKKLVSESVYYYICNVYEPRLGGFNLLPLTGFVYVFYNTIPQHIKE